MPDANADRSRLAQLLREVGTIMLVTDEPSGALRSRPMAIQEAEFDGTLRFFTNRESGKVEEIERDRHVNIAVSCPVQGIYASLSGIGTLEDDQAKKDELWRDEYKEWFPNGKDDPDLTILLVKVNEAEYWVIPNPDDSAKEQSREAEHAVLKF